jgi:NADH-quinone oxidoreductase subunit L
MTHAFFKALLFLGSGAVIHALHEEQNIWKMGALRSKIPTTHRTFFVACLAIAGIPPLAGFFSKDAILEKTFASGNVVLWAMALATAGLTAFYMFRLLLVTFHGESRVEAAKLAHIHRPSAWMRIPLVVLAVLSVVGGLVGVPILEGGNRIVPFLEEVVAQGPVDHDVGEPRPLYAASEPAGDGHGGGPGHDEHHLSLGVELGLMGLSVLVALIGIFTAVHLYIRRPGANRALRESPLGRLVNQKYMVDELYDVLFVRSTHALARCLWQGFDVLVIDGLVNGSGRLMAAVSGVVRTTQNGQAQAYLVSVVVGSAAVLAYFVLR